MQFKNLKDLENYLQSKVNETLNNQDSAVMDVVKDEVKTAAQDEVYDEYLPFVYQRRGEDDGLTDADNTAITGDKIENGKVSIYVDNITQSENGGHYLADLIEFGHGYKGQTYDYPYNRAGTEDQFLQPRPFMKTATNRINNNPTELLTAFKKDLAKKGIKTK